MSGLVRAVRIAMACGAAGLLWPAAASADDPPRADASAIDPIRAIFEDHDCCGRLVHSRIERIGELRAGSQRFTIYTLWFVNPESRHGMLHLAIVEGRRFVGSYIISDRVVPRIEGDRVRFRCRDSAACPASLGDDLVIENGALPPRLWVDGEVNQLGDSI